MACQRARRPEHEAPTAPGSADASSSSASPWTSSANTASPAAHSARSPSRQGVNHATLIQHFGSKEGLLTAVLEEWDRRTVENSLTDVSGLDYFRRLPDVMAAHQDNRGLLELFTTIAAEASSPAHPAHAFITQRYTANLATLAGHLNEAVDAGDVAPLTLHRSRSKCA